MENGKVEDVELSGAKARDEDVEDSHIAEWGIEYHNKPR